jgi:hypothetical protein
MHLPAGEGRCTLYEVDLVAGWRAFNASMWTRNWRKDDTVAKPLAIDTPAPVRTIGLLEPLPTTPAPIDEGGAVDPATIGALGQRFRNLGDDASAALRQVTTEAHDSGHSVSIAALPSVRRFEIGRALVAIADYGWDDELARALVAHVTGDDAIQQPGVPLGAAVGQLTIDQATRLSDLTSRLATSEIVVGCRPDGTLCVTGLAA